MVPTGSLSVSNVKKILIVSNSPTFLERNRGLLARGGVRILEATSSKEALKIHHREKVNLIIAMVEMPEMGGDMLCSLIRQERELRNVSCILICNENQGEIERASRCGANAWFTRPVKPVQLREKVTKLLFVSPRRDCRALLKAQVHGTEENFSFTGISHNISTSGILIESDRQLHENDIITGMFVSADSLEVVAEGKVVRSLRRNGTFSYGIQFSCMDSKYRREIEKYVANGT